jgi:hypothetical protein
MIRRIFINFAPVFLLLPASLAVGLYFFKKYDLLFSTENQLYFYYYIILAAAPLYLLLIRARPEFGHEILEVVSQFVERFSKHKLIYFTFVLAVSIFFLSTAYFHISTFTERDRWILEDEIPIIPIDAPIPLRAAWVLSRFLPIDMAVPVLGLFSMLFWFMFLVYVHGRESSQGWLVLMVFAFTFLNKSFFELLYANWELPSAIFGWIGLYGIWKRRISLGFLFVIAATVCKNSGIYQLAVAVALFAFVLYQDRSKKNGAWQKIDIPFLAFLLGYFALNYWGTFYYMFAFRGGPEYVLTTGATRVLWFSTFAEFAQILFWDYGIILFLGMIGIFVSRTAYFPLISFGSLIFLRSFSSLSVGYYPLIFLAALSFFSYFALSFFMTILNRWRLFVIFIALASVFNLVNFYILFSYYPFWMNKLNSNFNQFVQYTAENFPEGGRIYQREISLKPYLARLGRNRLGDIRYRIYPEDKQAALDEFALPGCKLIVMQRDDLGISVDELVSLGFSRMPYELRDEHGMWHSFSRDCQ